MNENQLLYPGQSAVSFDTRVSLDAVKGLEKSRSAMFLRSYRRLKDKMEEEKVKTVWDIKPIDFSVKMYQPFPPPRNSRESMMRGPNVAVWKKKSAENGQQARTIDPSVPQLQLPSLLIPKEKDKKSKFDAKFRSPSPQSARLIFIREGTYVKRPYVTESVSIHKRDIFRKLEDFRQYQKFGIMDFETRFIPDPQNLKFKHEMLSQTLPELSTTKQVSIRTCESAPIPKLRHPSRWDKNNHLPRSAYKKGRSPHSALMERVQSKIGWLSEKEKIADILRPDIYDHKTKDWCDVTKAPDERMGPYPIS